MPHYSFEALSDYDFECLARDLLQAELKLRLETFAKGKDSGIDLRYSQDPSKTLVVQCKHYANSGFSSLKSSVRSEVDKIKKLNPSRYILVTSVRLTPQRKSELLCALSPFCQTPQDIYGAEDLNNLLGLFPEIEKRNFKLWLTSATLIERALKTGVFNETSSEVSRIRKRLSRYVYTEAFHRAQDLLESNRYCIITGMPGIGKSTLAEMLIMSYVDQGWNAVRIWDHIRDAREVFDPGQKQVFYYDDFLGKTGLKEKLGKNEEERLLRFMSDVSQSDNSRFILTTREYILNQAMDTYESLQDSKLDYSKCVIALSDYHPLVRAKILYNHLYFSDLSEGYLEPFRSPSVYRSVIGHKNFSPRIIERMTTYLQVQGILPHEYVSEFRFNLDNPIRVWDHAYQHHISQASQNLLLVLATLDGVADVDDLAEAFQALYALRAQKYGAVRHPKDFKQALREIDGNFIKTSSTERRIIVEFHNPSIQDYMEAQISTPGTDLSDLVTSCIFSNQPERIWALNKELQSDLRFAKSLLQTHIRTSSHRSARLIKTPSTWVRSTPNSAKLYEFSLAVWAVSKHPSLIALIEKATSDFAAVIDEVGTAEWCSLLECYASQMFPPTDMAEQLASEIKVRLFEYVDVDSDTEFFGMVSGLLVDYPGTFTQQERALTQEVFGKFAKSRSEVLWSDEWADHTEALNELGSLENIAENLGSEVWDEVHSVRGRLNDRHVEHTYNQSTYAPRPLADAPDKTVDDEIALMFGNLSRLK